MSLYAHDAGSEDASACSANCAKAWPPLTAGGEVARGYGVAGRLLGAVRRSAGSIQVTYGDFPLRTFAKDRVSGDRNGEGGHAVGRAGPLELPRGASAELRRSRMVVTGNGAPSSRVKSLKAEDNSRLATEGETVYASNYSVCHGTDGDGKGATGWR